MTPENLTKEELVNWVKKRLLCIKKDYLNFKAGEYYDLDQHQDYDGLVTLTLYDDEGNGHYISLNKANELFETYPIQ
jgi:hypothetical protein